MSTEEHLPLNTHLLKTLLLDLPSLGSVMQRNALVGFTKIVVKGVVTRAEMVLQVVISPRERGGDYVEHYGALF